MMLAARDETMQNGNLKIGIIQSFPATADFSGNLRRIVQGYRECLDHGAELIIAPATALCGLAPLALTGRRSFMMQTRAALDALAAELGSVPLLLGPMPRCCPMKQTLGLARCRTSRRIPSCALKALPQP